MEPAHRAADGGLGRLTPARSSASSPAPAHDRGAGTPPPARSGGSTLSSLPDAVAALPGEQAPRQAAVRRALAAGLPSPEAEEWRYSRIDELDLDRFAPVVAAPPGEPGPVPPGPWAAVVTLVDGWAVNVTVHDEAVSVGTGDDEALGTVLGEAHDGLTEWSLALAPTPVTIRVHRGAQVEAPVLVRSLTTVDGGLSAPRLAVLVEEGASAGVVELQSSGDVAHLALPLVELQVAARARLAYTAVQEHGLRTWQVANLVARVGQEGSVTVALIGLGGAYARVRTDCRLDGRGASGDLLAAYFGEGDQTLDFRTFQDHRAPDTTSDLLFKGAVGDKSRSIYTGLITVRPEGRGTNAFQTNRNLKLSDEAWAESVPNLEIQNNDVRCSHASTVGPIDDDQRFYLESRGVPPEVAERLVVSGFFGEVLDRMPAPGPVREAIRGAIEARLDRQAAAGNFR